MGGPGSAGYDAGFWIRGGDFLLRINLTLQARFEAQDWDNPEPQPGGDLSGWRNRFRARREGWDDPL